MSVMFSILKIIYLIILCYREMFPNLILNRYFNSDMKTDTVRGQLTRKSEQVTQRHRNRVSETQSQRGISIHIHYRDIQRRKESFRDMVLQNIRHTQVIASLRLTSHGKGSQR